MHIKKIKKKKKCFQGAGDTLQSPTLKKVRLYPTSHHLPVSQNLHGLPSFLYLHMLYLQSSTLLLFAWAPWCTKVVYPLTRNSPAWQKGLYGQRINGEWYGCVSKESGTWLKLKSQPGDKAFRIRFPVWSKPPHHTSLQCNVKGTPLRSLHPETVPKRLCGGTQPSLSFKETKFPYPLGKRQ